MKRPDSQRAVGVVLHPGRDEALDAAAEFIKALTRRGLSTFLVGDHDRGDELAERVGTLVARVPEDGHDNCELVVVFGGDGSLLSGAEWALPRSIPVLGVNLGHVGFLAELDLSELEPLIEAVVQRDYEVESRLTLAVTVTEPDGQLGASTFAINEVSLEKASRERMLEVMVRVDNRPLSRWGCDGVLVSTPTGSTAYAFSAGGPVMWPDVAAIELVPLSAHALFARPLVLSPASHVDLDVARDRDTAAIVWADGRRGFDVAPGSRVSVVRGGKDLLIARLSEQPFTTRLVKKFQLPVEGFRGGSPSTDLMAEGD